MEKMVQLKIQNNFLKIKFINHCKPSLSDCLEKYGVELPCNGLAVKGTWKSVSYFLVFDFFERILENSSNLCKIIKINKIKQIYKI